MPPFIPHKRRLSNSSSLDPHRSESTRVARPKPSLFETADKPRPSASLHDNKTFLDQLDGSESDSSLSEVSSDEFEDVLAPTRPKRRKIVHAEEDDDIDWEDAIPAEASLPRSSAPEPSGDLELTLDDGNSAGFTNTLGKKKGPSKIERQIRVATHCMHVQFLLFHNLIRNGWACDKEAQEILLAQLPDTVRKEVNKWKVASGLRAELTDTVPLSRKRRKGKQAAQNERSQRDWGIPAERLERGAPNMSRGDPLIRLLKVLAAYWKKRWTITAPSLRKQGHKPLTVLEEEVASFKKGKYDVVEHGERVDNVQHFRDMARKCEGSRDIGSQLFTALVRGLGIEARLVTSLQPVGFGWGKGEESSTIQKKKSKPKADMDGETVSSLEDDSSPEVDTRQTRKPKARKKIQDRHGDSRGVKGLPIDLSEQSMNGDNPDVESDEDGSVIDVTPTTPRKRPNMNFDRDMVFPTYWTETVSPITNEVYPVDAFILNPAVATNSEHLASFESRGAKADKAKQVFAYIVGYNSDGTAKDVTTRYLKRHVWPGRTKGVRMPVEKVPVYNQRGKIKRYESYDWFKTVMSGYKRPHNMRTPMDDLEEAKDLKSIKPEKKDVKVGEDTLQGYKNSAEFVLERHLRREEAIKPGSKPVKTFASGKGEKAKEELVWLRKDVEVCRTGESWHKEGRVIKAGETPMKMVPIRAVTLTRKREVEEAERDSGEKLKQGLYAWDQTDWIIPPPIQNGIIPKNAYGNIDCFVPTMVPEGAVHIPLRSTMKICKRLNLDYAEAVTGFEFGNKRAVPVIQGVVVAAENEKAVIDEWEKDEEERRIKEEGKREKATLAMWRKWLMGLRIIERVREDYGGDATFHMKEGSNPFTNQGKARRSKSKVELESVGLPEPVREEHDENTDGGFLPDDDVGGGGFLLEGHEEETSRPEIELEVEGEVSAKPSNQPLAATTSNDHNKVGADIHSGITEKPKHKSIKSQQPEPHPKSKACTNTTKSSLRKGLNNGILQQQSDSNPSMETSDQKIPSRLDSTPTSRKMPKRQAARKSEKAVKSHYFSHDSDNDDVDSSEDGSEERLTSRPSNRKRKAGTLDSRRSQRVRKR